jgi:hypothetical protein
MSRWTTSMSMSRTLRQPKRVRRALRDVGRSGEAAALRGALKIAALRAT